MSKKERFKAYVAAYLVLVKEGQVLLLRRYNTGYQDGKYSLVAGHLDGDETAGQCILREAAEEAGIALKPEELEVVHVQHRRAPDREYIDIYLCASKWGGDVSNLEPEKCDELRWCPINELPDNILPEVKQALEHIASGVHYGEIGW
jgi:8-oxo-dGTP pyrophosphatase MutT (NUDIX family)